MHTLVSTVASYELGSNLDILDSSYIGNLQIKNLLFCQLYEDGGYKK